MEAKSESYVTWFYVVIVDHYLHMVLVCNILICSLSYNNNSE